MRDSRGGRQARADEAFEFGEALLDIVDGHPVLITVLHGVDDFVVLALNGLREHAGRFNPCAGTWRAAAAGGAETVDGGDEADRAFF